jgi:c-di-GMP-binding flagellar brake protein YcgR
MTAERRTARRYDLSLPVIIRVPVEKESSSSRNGKTRNISTRGVYFLVENDLNEGSELDLTMTLPAEVTGGTEVFIRAIGKVLRTEKHPDNGNQRVGVAAIIERYEIIRNDLATS